MYILPKKFLTELVASGCAHSESVQANFVVRFSYIFLEETDRNPTYGTYVILLTTFRDVQNFLGDKNEVVEPTCWKLYTSHIGSSRVLAWILENVKKIAEQIDDRHYSYIKLMKI